VEKRIDSVAINVSGYEKYKKGLFIGRFQPLHIGHMHTITEALRMCDTLVIGIGSSQEHGTDRNPFDLETRINMINAAIADARMHAARIRIMAIPDLTDDKAWFRYVMKHSPGIEIVFSDNPWVTGIFVKEGIPTQMFDFGREHITATNVRRLIREGRDWPRLVPPTTVQIIEQNIGVVRGKRKSVP